MYAWILKLMLCCWTGNIQYNWMIDFGYFQEYARLHLNERGFLSEKNYNFHFPISQFPIYF